MICTESAASGFCTHEKNCVVAPATSEGIKQAVHRLLTEPELFMNVVEGGRARLQERLNGENAIDVIASMLEKKPAKDAKPTRKKKPTKDQDAAKVQPSPGTVLVDGPDAVV